MPVLLGQPITATGLQSKSYACEDCFRDMSRAALTRYW